jgi:hypothetical protein
MDSQDGVEPGPNENKLHLNARNEPTEAKPQTESEARTRGDAKLSRQAKYRAHEIIGDQSKREISKPSKHPLKYKRNSGA